MTTNEDIIRELYAAAEANGQDVDRFAAFFHEDGYFQDEASGQQWYGDNVRQPIEALGVAFPDMHRELLRFYATGDTVIVELKLQGTHKGDFPSPIGTLPATGKIFDVPCCDVFHLRDGKVTAFHCYNEAFVWLRQLGAFDDVKGGS
ncbi:steroid delta-isomerase-like uncharacterized protein [Novosphingobium chloroacetimidivorans]|uniref:Steroid delta-isomerase-like uncharacterized protein n=1 Tax=Novosphingobium chloroacetimidivorans TaxID=1428314 RepID=A0A7W7KAX7_9SPHN|nr:nuclear transport factor 2 family protein [Novosphingobium chloroacetimidivorans]MBB4858723.1 steroid delta-isomerase-like uncharacterized protein [Novosphingobium chloroacetimidivorans]